MTLAASMPQLRLPGLQRLAPPRPCRRLQPCRLRCSSQQAGDDSQQPFEDDSSSSKLGAFRQSGGKPPLPATPFKGFGKQPSSDKKPNTTEALLSSLGGVSTGEGRTSKSNNIILGNDNSEETWRELDEQVNEYPGQRTFKAIGSGGAEFVSAMVKCAEQVVGPLHEECVSTRASAKGNYTSVTLSVWVESPDQVLAIYSNMKEDSRLRFFF